MAAGSRVGGLPVLFNYRDYRIFLRDWYAARKAREPGFSYAVFARRAGLGSRAHFQNVTAGRLNLPPEGVERFSKGLRLTREEAEFFALLVASNQAKGARERQGGEEAVQGWLLSHHRDEIDEQRMEKLFEREARWLVLCLTRLRGFRADPAWISRKLNGSVSASDAREALAFLRANGYIRVSGRRLLRTVAGAILTMELDDDPISRRWARTAYRRASDLRGRAVDSMTTLHAILTPEQARALAGRLRQHALASFPRMPGPRFAGKLHAVLLDVVPLSR